MSKKKLSYFALIIFSTIFSVILAEKGASLWTSSLSGKDICSAFSINDFATSRGFSLANAFYKPNEAVIHCNNEYNYTYHIDQVGLRSHLKYREIPKILAIGDSFTFGFGVEDEQAFPALLGAYNAGMWGNPFDVQYQSFLRNVDLLKPDVVIWGIYPPHIITMFDGSWNKNCPGDMSYPIHNPALLYLLKLLPLQTINKSALVKILFKPFDIWSVSLDKGNFVVRKNCYETKEILLFDENIGSTSYTSNKKVNLAYKNQLLKVTRKMSKYFNEAKRIADKKGIKIIFLNIPSRLYLNLNSNKKDLKYSYSGASIVPARPRDIVKNAVIKGGFKPSDFLDLGEFLLAEQDNWKEYYFTIDAHWNAHGHQFVAQIIHNFLVDKKIIEH